MARDGKQMDPIRRADGRASIPPGRGTDHRPKAAGKAARRAKQPPAPAPVYRPLVDEYRLTFRAVTFEPVPEGFRRKEMGDRPGLENDLETFRLAFRAVWDGIPRGDRHRLLTHWRGRHDRAVEETLPADLDRRPLILVVDEIPEPYRPRACSFLGTMLLFPLPLMWDDPEHLRAEIAVSLATAYRYANRRHWALAVEMIEEPYEEWEKRQKGKVSHARRDRKLDELEARHLIAYHAEMAELHGRWGLTYQPVNGG